jgi:hypothetical protein
MYRVRAVSYQPELLYRIAFTETAEDLKVVEPFAKEKGDSRSVERVRAFWNDAEPKLRGAFPESKLVQQTLSAYDAAAATGLKDDFNGRYRYYCRFTHGNLRALEDIHADLGPLDNASVGFAILLVLQCIQNLGAKVEKLDQYTDEFGELSQLLDAQYPDTPLA